MVSKDATALIDPVFFLIFGGPILFLGVLVVLFLRKPLLATVPAPPHAVRRDLAYRIRATGYPVEFAKDVLRVKFDSLAALKLHIRETWEGGSEIRYEVDATTKGWALVLILALIGYVAIASIVVALLIHFRARRFARSRVAPLLSALPPLGMLPPADVRSLLIEGLSEAQRLSSEALEYEREAGQNAIGLVLLAAVVLWAILFVTFALYVPLSSDAMASAAIIATAVSGAGAALGLWLVHEGTSGRAAELEQDASFYRALWAAEAISAPPSGEPRGGLELLLRAALRSPYWREIRRRRRFWHDPVAGLAMFVFAYGAVMLSMLAIVTPLPLEWRAFLGGFGALLGLGGLWFVRSWIREVRGQDERDRRDWEKRRETIEAELWRILSG